MSKLTPLFAAVIGGVTGFYYRDEIYFPTNMRIKVAMLEYHMLSRQKPDMDVLDIIDANSASQLNQRSRKVIEAFENEINSDDK